MTKFKYDYYVVVSGKKRGIFTDWDTCRELTEGYSESKYCGFNSLFEALKFFLRETGIILRTENFNKKI